jgi:AsmA protein
LLAGNGKVNFDPLTPENTRTIDAAWIITVGMAIGAVVLVLIMAVMVFAATFNVNQYRGRIQAELEKRLDRNVSLGDMHLGLFPPGFQVQNLSIADDLKFNSAKPFVEAQELDVSIKLLPLLHKSVEISSLSLRRGRALS